MHRAVFLGRAATAAARRRGEGGALNNEVGGHYKPTTSSSPPSLTALYKYRRVMETRTSRRSSVSRSGDEHLDSQQLQPGHETHLGE